jgi:putative SOS response-associated peptidase YedK
MSARLINARAETVQEKPSFRTALKRRRCLIVADGFYEWQKTSSGKQPYFFYQPYLPEPASEPAKSSEAAMPTEPRPARQPFGFAGLWEHWEVGDGSVLESCTIVTTEANADMQPIHDRMPVILSPRDYDLWLDPGLQDGEAVRSLLTPGNLGDLARYPVSTVVNNARHDSPDCLEPLA